MHSYKVYWWDGTSIDARWELAATRELAAQIMLKLRSQGALCCVIIGPHWTVLDSWSEGEAVSLDEVLGRRRPEGGA